METSRSFHVPYLWRLIPVVVKETQTLVVSLVVFLSLLSSSSSGLGGRYIALSAYWNPVVVVFFSSIDVRDSSLSEGVL